MHTLSQADELDGSLTPSRGKASATPLYPEVDYSIESSQYSFTGYLPPG